MIIKLKFNSIFAYSESENKYCYYEFSSGINVIGGENTSGKSSLLQMLLYAFGINDVKESLSEILEYKPVIRLDCELFKNGIYHRILFIRDDDFFYIKYQNKVLSFSGINSNQAQEHIRLKNYLSELFDFSLMLESNGEFKNAPIEAMFMPYYISQSVGWVSIRKSFGGFDYYKNFREDYLDYYLGVESWEDREKKAKLNKQLSLLELNFDSLKEVRNSDDYKSPLFIDEDLFNNKSEDYINEYKTELSALISKEKENINLNNELSYYKMRKSILSKVSTNLLQQNPVEEGVCPVCKQHLRPSFSENYKYYQDFNNTDSETNICRVKIKEVAAKIDSNIKVINKLKSSIDSRYRTLNASKINSIDFSSWLSAKIDSAINNQVTDKLSSIQSEIIKIKDELKLYKSPEDLKLYRSGYSVTFQKIFINFLSELNVQKPNESRFLDIYKISALPYQGVELLKAILAYNFAFNKIIVQNNSIHRLPFILDAVFKEDFTGNNEELVCKFIAENKPNDTQLFVSMAGDKAPNFAENYLKNSAKLIIIGNQGQSRCLFKEYNGGCEQILQEINEIINSI